MDKALQTGQGEIFQTLSPLGMLGKYVEILGRSQRLFIQYFIKAPSVGKQFVMISLDGELKHVFAISAGKGWSPTSTFASPFGVNGMMEEAESSKWPGRDGTYGYRNMDYFINFYGNN